ncbi:MAG: RNA 2',3'-cyclic phosphodiesterase [Caldilineales bacterium]|nr:RNA 2',3'-cyclic phosphodiesterase [Caldilineales bacterium]MDW8316315.1 RNA 2',3'-cyclic phosphodiesterase [Anaerolineae bacterium]
MPSSSLRLFIALELAQDVRNALAKLQDALRRQLPPGAVRWTAVESIHLTLKFLGETPADRVPAIAQAMEQAAAGFGAFEYTVAGFGCFPNARRANVLWVGVPEPPKALLGLQRSLDVRLHALGYPREDRAFTPHLTIGRVNKSISSADRSRLAEALAQVQVAALGVVPVHEMVLFQSDLRPTGAVYTALARAALRAAE